MTRERISRVPRRLRDQIEQAAAAVAAEANWPATAPSAADVTQTANDLAGLITQYDQLKAQLDELRFELRHKTRDAFALMKRIDAVTDGLYGGHDTRKNNFALPPRKRRGSPDMLTQVVIRKITDGVSPHSIFVDWTTDPACRAYELQWFDSPELLEPVGAVAITNSEYEISSLTPGRQYWVRVRSLSGKRYGQWSDPATRIANL